MLDHLRRSFGVGKIFFHEEITNHDKSRTTDFPDLYQFNPQHSCRREAISRGCKDRSNRRQKECSSDALDTLASLSVLLAPINLLKYTISASFPTLHDFYTHLLQTILGLASRKHADGRDRFVRVLLGKGPSLFQPITLRDNFSCLLNFC